jgi:3-deoxy-D-arabino-heptulosonate 7-phosphate (DAHP) synthase
MRYMTDDLRIKEIKELAPPSHLLREFPCDEAASRTVFDARNAIHRILHGMDDRLVVMIRRPRSSTRNASRCSATASPANSRSSCGCTSKSRAPRSAGRG